MSRGSREGTGHPLGQQCQGTEEDLEPCQGGTGVTVGERKRGWKSICIGGGEF